MGVNEGRRLPRDLNTEGDVHMKNEMKETQRERERGREEHERFKERLGAEHELTPQNGRRATLTYPALPLTRLLHSITCQKDSAVVG